MGCRQAKLGDILRLNFILSPFVHRLPVKLTEQDARKQKENLLHWYCPSSLGTR